MISKKRSFSQHCPLLGSDGKNLTSSGIILGNQQCFRTSTITSALSKQLVNMSSRHTLQTLNKRQHRCMAIYVHTRHTSDLFAHANSNRQRTRHQKHDASYVHENKILSFVNYHCLPIIYKNMKFLASIANKNTRDKSL